MPAPERFPDNLIGSFGVPKNFTEAIFEASAPPYQVPQRFADGAIAVDFWRSFYVQRPNARTVFQSFTRKNTHGYRDYSVLCISGPIGCGKSTFITDKLNKRDLCGIYIDSAEYRGKLRHQSRDTVENNLRSIFLDAAVERLERHFNYLRTRDKPAEYRTDSTYGFVDGSADPANRRRPQIEVRCDCAALLACFSKSAVATNLRDDLGLVRDTIPPLEELLEISVRIHRKKLHREVIRHATLDDVYCAYTSLFASPDAVPCLILDQIDELLDTDYQSHVFDAVLNIAQGLRARAQDYAVDWGHQAKIVCLVRDSNLSRLSLENAGVVPTLQVALTRDGQELSGVAKYYELEQRPEFVVDVISRRLDYVSRNIDALEEVQEPSDNVQHWIRHLRLYRNVMNFLWLEPELSPQDRDAGLPRISQFCGKSVRLALELANAIGSRITLDVIGGTLDVARNSGELEEYFALRASPTHLSGTIVHWFSEHADSRHLVRRFLHSKREIIDRQQGCCAYRFILSILDTRRSKDPGDTGLKYSQLREIAQRYFDIDDNSLREHLIHLFRGQRIEGDFILIHQKWPKREPSPEQIDEDSEIRITGRGVALKEYILRSFEFWHLLDQSESNTVYRPLFHRTPTDALRCIREVLDILSAAAIAHGKTWITQVSLGAPEGASNAFDAYQGVVIGKGRFYLEQVAEVHRHYVREYVAEALRGPRSRLVLGAQSRQFYSCFDPSWQGAKNTGFRTDDYEAEIREMISKLHERPRSEELAKTLDDIMRCMQAYSDLTAELDKLRQDSSPRALEHVRAQTNRVDQRLRGLRQIRARVR